MQVAQKQSAPSPTAVSLTDVLGLAHEGSGNHVNVVPNAEALNVVAILLRDGGQVNHHTRQVHVLLLPQGEVVHDAHHHLTAAGGGACARTHTDTHIQKQGTQGGG
jgi:hypothetical protein